METTAKQVAEVLASEAAHELAQAHEKIKHCLEQLTDEQVWWRPTESMNAIGNLVLHLSGNLGQWVVAGVGGKTTSRNRPAEFAERGPIPKTDLIARLDSAVAESIAAISSISPDELVRQRHVQGRDVTGIAAFVHAITHFCGHTQEVVHLTRTQLGDRYKFSWVPSTPEEVSTPK